MTEEGSLALWLARHLIQTRMTHGEEEKRRNGDVSLNAWAVVALAASAMAVERRIVDVVCWLTFYDALKVGASDISHCWLTNVSRDYNVPILRLL